ncbi:MAG: hypothetical protein ACLFPL_05555 [Candidatus Nanoarchaeia archaeon]
MLQKKNMIKWMFSMIIMLLTVMCAGFATQEQIAVDVDEFVDQEVKYNPIEDEAAPYEVSTTLTGIINITNKNADATISDIFVTFNNASNITTPQYLSGRNGTILDNTSDEFTIRIFELEAGESSVWNYTIDNVSVNPPLELSTNYSDSKILAGDSITITDNITNNFVAPSYNTDACIFNVELSQNTYPINFSGNSFEFVDPATSPYGGTDSANAAEGADNTSLIWDVLDGSCLNTNDSYTLSYDILSPVNIGETNTFNMTNTTLSYQLNNTISYVRFDSLTAIASDNVSLEIEKEIVGISNPSLPDTNVTWNGTGRLISNSNISLLLTEFSIWVANYSEQGDPNTRDVDSIDGTILEQNYTDLDYVLNSTNNTYQSPTWLFNYTTEPVTPILYGKPTFQIHDDGTQIVNRTVTQNGDDIFIKELYLVLGYWLEVNKNITSLGQDEYNIRVEVYNKGNQVTPLNSIVSLYDFVPENFNITSNLSDITSSSFYPVQSTWYEPTYNNVSITGSGFNGTMLTWGLVGQQPDSNTSFAQGPRNGNFSGDGNYDNTTFVVSYNVTGEGEYSLLDVFVTGVDPQQIDGASTANGVFVEEFVERVKSVEGMFAAMASFMFVLGLIV